MGAFCPDRRCRRPQCRALRRPFLPCLIRRWAIHRLRPQCQRLRTTKFPLRQGTFVMRVADNGAEAVPASGLKRYFQEARRSEEHTSELQSLMRLSYAVYCLTKKTQIDQYNT